jgi:hypothetical protein
LAEFAKHIICRREGMEIDGQEFPWYMDEDAEVIRPTRSQMGAVRITIPCERIELLDPLPKPVSEDSQ